ncbi:MAG: 50S ribosomal protein L28 [Chthonomonadales bacterium]
MKQCSVCGKGVQFGQDIRYHHGGKWELRAQKTKRRWIPNLQSARIATASGTKKVQVCVKCLKANKIARVA